MPNSTNRAIIWRLWSRPHDLESQKTWEGEAGHIKIYVGFSKVFLSYTDISSNGVIALCGMTDAEDKHILICSCRDNSVRLYDLPSFSGMGRLFAKKEV
ncbi:zinc finger CCCH domain-containing protein 48-like [Gastrolobium bilobum]|uniref:zinc finger CCCH domain-containing protein 48-like n=1 Tax=Gastrolobium bilobum TaxID=150636 RepID=UPI002AB19E6D|nr:zinc finger CCCH domain-containing protein 48-like [Gastrolobium bilobum]